MDFFRLASLDSKIKVAPDATVTLHHDNWDDWSKYRTMFAVHVRTPDGEDHFVGRVKIGQQGLNPSATRSPGARSPSLPDRFDQLEDNFFSLGEDQDYYLSIDKLSKSFPEIALKILAGLNDCALDLSRLDRFSDETVMSESLLRNVSLQTVKTRYNKITRGDAVLTRFAFDYTFPLEDGEPPRQLAFDSIPDSLPPTNVHVLIGPNGVGKTRTMNNLAQALIDAKAGNGAANLVSPAGMFSSRTGESATSDAIADAEGMVLVTFSAFDSLRSFKNTPSGFKVVRVGLEASEDIQPARASLSIRDVLAKSFASSFFRCSKGDKYIRWSRAYRFISDGDLTGRFENQDVLAPQESEEKTKEQAQTFFRSLSSGHAIVLLTITRLVELVEERTLVIIDEPESHLHPPLLTAFIRALSDLLINRNGLAILATHSPVVLQEVPASCVWKLYVDNGRTRAMRPQTETFGENISELTHEVFAQQVSDSGYYRLLKEKVDIFSTYDSVRKEFNGQLGSDARAMIQGLITGMKKTQG